ncbi:DUF2637 domain-containing protein [Actinoplanes nipponensis]|uniref:DUF2637 domain-containing protein n=1 Tax=Actinoplanes nipponensis TaxID=135950 RepID=UPI0035EF7976
MRSTLVLGVAASVVANVLHALDNPISQAIAAWPPLALLLTVELISRVPVHRRSLAFARLLATATIAGIAAWVSYWHMVGVAARYGETGASPYLLPLSVDGLIVVASICLVELAGRITALENEAAEGAPARAAEATPATTVAPAGGHDDAGVPGLIPVPSSATVRRGPTTSAALAEVAAALPRKTLPRTRGAEVSAFAPTLTRQGRVTASTRTTATSAKPGPGKPRAGTPGATTPGATKPGATTPGATTPGTAKPGATKPGAAKRGAPADAKPPAKARRTPAETLDAAAKIKAADPDITEADLAARLGISASRWRTIRRQADREDLRLAA